MGDAGQGENNHSPESVLYDHKDSLRPPRGISPGLDDNLPTMPISLRHERPAVLVLPCEVLPGEALPHEVCVKNPCIDVCKFDKKTGWCVGCGRTKDDCRDWKKASKKRLEEIKHALPRRLEKLEERGRRVS